MDTRMTVTTSRPMERALGRALALCAHPVMAWRVAPVRCRLLVAASYGALAYVATLVALLSWHT